jgi:DNA-binding response OmpR family regulator
MGGETKRILVVDDDSEICEIVEAMLAERGFAVACASDGASMRRVLARQRFDLVLLHDRMPGEPGRALAALARAQSVLVILMSGHPDALQQLGGTDRFLAKPFRSAELYAAVEAALSAPRLEETG